VAKKGSYKCITTIETGPLGTTARAEKTFKAR
jgi:hypothetical protein